MGFPPFLNQYQIKPKQVELSRQQLAKSPSRKHCSERELVTDIFKLNLQKSGLLWKSIMSLQCVVGKSLVFESRHCLLWVICSLTGAYPLGARHCSGSEWQQQIRNFTITASCKVGRKAMNGCGEVARLAFELGSCDCYSVMCDLPHCRIVSSSSGCHNLIRPWVCKQMLTCFLNVRWPWYPGLKDI